MAQQIQVNLAFNADTSKAKAQINDLMNSLNKIANKDTQIFDDRKLLEASTAAKDLQRHLQAAVNVNTGKLDLNKFSQSLSQSKQNLSDLYNSLSKAGSQGQQAFLQLASSIASSDSSVLNLNSKIKDLGQTLKNTIKWQLSSSLVHGFMGAMSQAIGYARDLNSSLNDIRIVTGASVDEMARFAEQANKSAKALSTTTTEYTKASLIYYQQGLNDQQVKERTDITIKMANAAGQSAQVVSDQLTAIWNNFYEEGGKSLEYYADVMTALGAATASSTDEIAGGLEKFAAIGDTIGLSYEYAASALATITSNTRQSEEVVGTALKTIFARIQGLNLGETLDDGTTLNKYSEALEKVGINIFDQSGELKNMDNILNELGSKWQTLSKDQQIALSQTVAGTRQYTQLIALMDNWNNGDNDSFQANLATAYGAEGTLQEQQDIYAEGWEAAANRVKTAAEDIYDSLINDEAIVTLLNGLEKVLSFTSNLIDGFGGLKGILLLIGGIFTKQFASEMPEAMEKLKNNFEILTGQAQKKKQATIQETIDITQSQLDNKKFKTSGDRLRAENTIEESKALLELEKSRHKLSATQYENIKRNIEEKKASKDLQATLLDEIDVNEKKFNQLKKQATKGNKDMIKDRINNLELDKETEKELAQGIRYKKSSEVTMEESNFLKDYEKKEKLRDLIPEAQGTFDNFGLDLDTTSVSEGINILTDELRQLYQQQEQCNQVNEEFQGQLDSFDASVDFISGTDDIKKQQQEIERLSTSMTNYAERLRNIEGFGIATSDVNDLTARLSKCREVMETFGATNEEIAQEMNNIFKEWSGNVGTELFQDLISGGEKAEIKMEELGDSIQTIVNALQLLSPEKFKELAAEAERTGQSVASLILQMQKSQNAPLPDTSIQAMGFSQALTRVASLGMEIGAVFSSVGAAISICFDENATAAEKFTAVLSTIPTALMSIADITQILKDGPEIYKGLAEGFGSLGKSLESAASSGGLLSGVAAKLAPIFTGATASVGGFAIALGTVVGIAAAVVAGVWLLIKAIEYLQSISPEGRLEAAKKATEGMTKAANEANDAYKNLLDTINSYNSASDALDGLTEGTQEYTEALIAANNEARELIELYGLLPEDYHIENGRIIIDKNALEDAKETYSEDAKTASSAQSSIKRTENLERLNYLKHETQEKFENELIDFGGDGTKNLEGIYETILEEFGSISAFTNTAGQREQLQQAVANKAFDGFETAVYMPTIMDNMHLFQDYEQQYAKVYGENANSRKLDLTQSLADNQAFQESLYGDAIVNQLLGDQEAFTASVNEVKAEYEQKSEESGNDSALYEAFEKLLPEGYEVDSAGTVYDSTGKATESQYDRETMMNTVAETQIMGQLESEGAILAAKLNSITANLSDSEQNITQAVLNGDASRLTKENVSILQNMTSEEIQNAYPFIQSLSTLGFNIDDLLSQLTISLDKWQPPKFDTEQWKNNYNTIMDIINELNIGDSISLQEYEQLDEQLQQYFAKQLDGTYTLIGAAEELRNIAKQIEIDKLKDSLVLSSEISDIIATKTKDQKFADSFNSPEKVTQWTDQMQSGLDKGSISQNYAKYLLTESNVGSSMIEALDINLQNYNNDYLSALQELINKWANEQGSIREAIALAQDSIRELDAELESGNIGQKEYDEAFNSVVANEALMHDLDLESIQNYADYLANANEELKDNEKLCKKIALSYHRWDKGVKTISDNFKKWTENIKKANKNSKDYINTIEGMKDAYKDVFNEVDPEVIEQLSDEFLTNEKNLKLLEKGLAGDEQAWNDWESTVLQEINSINPAFADVSAEMKTQMNDLVIAASNLDFSGLTPGASIDDTDFNAKLNSMVFSTAEAAQAMSDNLSSVGVDAEIQEHTYTVPPNSNTTTQGGSFVITPPDGPPVTIPISASYTETDEGKTYTWYTLKGAKYNGKGVTGGGGSSGKGGGGGGSKQPPKHAEKKSDSDKTRYHTLTNQLEDLKSEYEDIAEASDRAFGQDKLDAIDAEIDKTDELIKKQEEYIEAISDNLPQDKAIMEAYWSGKDSYFKKNFSNLDDIEFDARGNISNYDDIQDDMFRIYNEATEKWTEDSEDWQVFEKKYEEMERYIEQYEETYDLLRDEETAYQELLNQRIDLELEKVQYKVEIALEIPEEEIAVIEYQLNKIEDDAFKSGETIGLLTKQAEALNNQIEINKQGLNDALALSLSAAEIVQLMAGNTDVLMDKNFTEDQIESIREYRDNLLDLNEEFDNIREQVEEQVIEVFDAWNEKLEEGMETLDHYGNVLESYKNIVDVIGKDTLGLSNQFMQDLEQASIDNAIDEVEAAKSAYESMLTAQKDAEKALDEARAINDEASIKMWEENLRTINEETQAAQEDLLSKWEDALNTIAETFEATVERVVETFNESIYALGGLEGLSEEFSRQQETADILVDDYQKIYELSKLSRDINKTIDDTDLIGGKQKLKKLLGEINKLQEDGVEMSQYDLEYLQKTYDLRLAELELEEAQRAKNTVRLSKDNEGNWSYIYTQNTDAVDSAQQKYEDALYAMQDLSSNYIDEMSEQLISTSQEMQDALAAIRIQDYASIDDYYAEVERVQKQYQDELRMQEEELQKAIDNNKVLYDEDWTNYHNATGYKISDTENFITTFKDSMLGTLMDSTSDVANFTDIMSSAVDQLTVGLMQGAMDYYISLEEAMNAAGTSTGTFADDTAKNIDEIVAKSQEGAEAVDQMALEMQEALGAVIESVTDWQEAYGLAMQNIIDTNLEVINSFNDMLKALSVEGNTKVTVDYGIKNSANMEDDPSAFDTGGYTGSWGKTGKIGILHEKELILAPHDTNNMLTALTISKSILDTIDLNARQASMGIGYMTPSVVKEDNTQTLEQNVHITAEFPSLTDHYEVEEALNNLINTASQYANRK